MRQVPIYYINLASSPDRRVFMETQLAAVGCVARRVEAITPADLTLAQTGANCNPLRPFSMTKRQYSCNLSHAKAWAAFVETGAPFGLFLEDDVLLSKKLPRFLDALEEASADADIIRIETWPRYAQSFDRAAEPVLPGEVVLRTCLDRDAGAAGYLLSRRAAVHLLADPHLHRTLVDGLLFDPFRMGKRLKIRYADPGLCAQLCNIGSLLPEAKTTIGGADDAAYGQQRRGRSVKARVVKQMSIWFGYSLPRWIFMVRRVGQADFRGAIPFSEE